MGMDFELTFEQIDFWALESKIQIIPNFSAKSFHLIKENFGPFSVGKATQVSLWFALYLRDRQKCRILAPQWFNIQSLEQYLVNEKNSTSFCKMPDKSFYEISVILCKKATEDIADLDAIRTIVKDIFEVRLRKLQFSIKPVLESK